MMSPSQAIDALVHVPYAPGKGDMAGADCFGIVELYYRLVLGIEVTDRADHPAGHGGLQAGFDAAANWVSIQQPEDHCLVIMRAKVLLAGHIGIYHSGHVLHSDESHGCVFEPINGRFIRSRITGFLRRK